MSVRPVITDMSSESVESDPDRDAASKVVLSYPADLSTWGRDTVEGRRFRAYLRKVHDDLAVGDTWAEFVGVGCCGNTLDVPIKVEAIEGAARMGANTDIAFEVREACDIQGGWQVQSESGPTE
jgi:hypothetical protein